MPPNRYIIVRHEDEWLIKFGDEEYGPYRSQAEAMLFAIDVCPETLSWRLTLLGALTDPQTIADWLAKMAEPILVLATFIAAGLLAFPVNLLISRR